MAVEVQGVADASVVRDMASSGQPLIEFRVHIGDGKNVGDRSILAEGT